MSFSNSISNGLYKGYETACYYANYVTSSLFPTYSTSTLGQEQFEKMAIPRDVEKEYDLSTIEEGRAFAKELEAKLASLAIPDSRLKELTAEIQTLDFKNASASPLLLNRDLPYIAIEALRRGFLDPEHGPKQAATILLFWSALQYHEGRNNDLRTIPFFLGGEINPFAESLITQTLSFNPKQAATVPYLDGEKFNRFINEMRKLPPSEQRLLLVPNLQDDTLLEEITPASLSRKTISQAIMSGTIQVFNRVMLHYNRIIPTVGMMQALLDAEYDEPVKITPRLYLSTLMQLRECGLNDTRDMMVPFPDSQGKSRCPSTADGYQAPGYDFSYHDFYHAMRASEIGKTYRTVGINAFDAVFKIITSTSPKGIQQFAEKLLDLEYTQFSPNQPIAGLVSEITPAIKFWYSLIWMHIGLESKYLLDNPTHTASQFKASVLSEHDMLEIMKAIYHTCVNQENGPNDLNTESVLTVAKMGKNNVEDVIKNQIAPQRNKLNHALAQTHSLSSFLRDIERARLLKDLEELQKLEDTIKEDNPTSMLANYLKSNLRN